MTQRHVRPCLAWCTLMFALAAPPAVVAALETIGATGIPAVSTSSTIRVWVDQIGYRPQARKLAVIAGDAPLPQTLSLSIRDAVTGRIVWQLGDHPGAVFKFDNGEKDQESGDFVDQLDFSSFQTPGRYIIVVWNGTRVERSYMFNIGRDVYKQAAEAAWKAYYYESADHDLPPKYGGLWTHALDHYGPNQATAAHVYKWDGGSWPEAVGTQVIDQTPYDVRGGWYDAGDFNKYTVNEATVQDELLFGLELLGDSAKKAHLNIPPSSGNEYDLLNIVRYCSEFLIRDCDHTGASFGRIHETGMSPPEADKNATQLTVVNSASTMARAAGLALSSVVWSDLHQDPVFAKRCYEESLRSWNLMLARPFPWPVDPKDPTKEEYTGDGDPGTPHYHYCLALAAACYFRITHEERYEAIVRQEVDRITSLDPGGDLDLYPVFWIYTQTKGADPATVARIKTMMLDAADKVVLQTGPNRGYAACIKGYWWGCNAYVGGQGVCCLLAAQFASNAAERHKYLQAAEEYVHYLLGRNAIGLCFLTNLGSIGAEHSAMMMFHGWVGNANMPYGAKYIGDGPGKIGPWPGMVVGGTQPTMKNYINTLDWRQNPWEWNEPDIGYQAPCATLIAYFAFVGGS